MNKRRQSRKSNNRPPQARKKGRANRDDIEHLYEVLPDEVAKEFAKAHEIAKEVPPLRPRTDSQKLLMDSIVRNTITFATGPAGVGKTYLAVAMAAQALQDRKTDRIVVVRPAVEAGEKLGALPGTLDEKFQPYADVMEEAMIERLGRSFYQWAKSRGKIVAKPLAYMRGSTFHSSWVLLDEAQNTTPEQMKMFLTRTGEDCTVVVCGDPGQGDLGRGKSNGLVDALSKLHHVRNVGCVSFSPGESVRSGITRDIVMAYEKKPRQSSTVPALLLPPPDFAIDFISP